MKLETKVQIEALKLLEKGIEPKYAESPDGKSVYITSDGFSAVRIDEDRLWIDQEKMKQIPSMSDLFNNTKIIEASGLKVSDKLHRSAYGEIGDILIGNGFDVCVNSKHLKLMYKDGCMMYAKNEKSPVYFVLNGDIYAVIMPMNTRLKKE